ENLCVLAALPDAVAVIGQPRAGFFHEVAGDAEIDEFTHFGDAFAVHDIEFNLAERRRHFIFDDLDPRLVADGDLAFFNRTDAADVEADRGVEFQRVAAG